MSRKEFYPEKDKIRSEGAERKERENEASEWKAEVRNRKVVAALVAAAFSHS